jgi:hypothetical protein
VVYNNENLKTLKDMFRRLPPVCLSIAIARLLTGKLRLSRQYVGTQILTENDKVFRIFRNIRIRQEETNDGNIVFVVQFKFARLSHRANKLASFIPMLIIAGHPGFIQKIYAADHDSGRWQGMYQWKSREYLEQYKRSFVYRMMNKRAVKSSIMSFDLENTRLIDYIEKNIKH